MPIKKKNKSNKDCILAHVREVIHALYRQYGADGNKEAQEALYNVCKKELDSHPELIKQMCLDMYSSVNYFVRQMLLNNIKED